MWHKYIKHRGEKNTFKHEYCDVIIFPSLHGHTFNLYCNQNSTLAPDNVKGLINLSSIHLDKKAQVFFTSVLLWSRLIAYGNST